MGSGEDGTRAGMNAVVEGEASGGVCGHCANKDRRRVLKGETAAMPLLRPCRQANNENCWIIILFFVAI